MGDPVPRFYICFLKKGFDPFSCYELPYSSQNSGYMDNLIEQKHKLGERIFEHYEYGEGWCKKKGMHWKTFNRYHQRYQDLEHQWNKHVAKHLYLF